MSSNSLNQFLEQSTSTSPNPNSAIASSSIPNDTDTEHIETGSIGQAPSTSPEKEIDVTETPMDDKNTTVKEKASIDSPDKEGDASKEKEKESQEMYDDNDESNKDDARFTMTPKDELSMPLLVSNNSIYNNLNKSLKAKQKIIASNEPLPKNTSTISELLNNEDTSKQKPKNKKKNITKRTDFFAAKLASAVDEVESSDSDETFVYESNVNDYVPASNSADISTQQLQSTQSQLQLQNQLPTQSQAQSQTTIPTAQQILSHQTGGQQLQSSTHTQHSEQQSVDENDENKEHNNSFDSIIQTHLNTAPQNQTTTQINSVKLINKSAPPIVNKKMYSLSQPNVTQTPSQNIQQASTTPTLELTDPMKMANLSTVTTPDLRESPTSTLKRESNRSNSIYSIPQLTIPLINEELQKQQEASTNNPSSPISQHFIPTKALQSQSSVSNLNTSQIPNLSHHSQHPQHAPQFLKNESNSSQNSIMTITQQQPQNYNNNVLGQNQISNIPNQSVNIQDISMQRRDSITNGSINEFVVQDISDDDSINDDFYSSTRSLKLNNSSQTTNTNTNQSNVNTHGNHISKSRKNYRTQNKLRSTTSKLFDKKGSQPRRYSIIPDNIDIEDFDDELMYYDNVNNIDQQSNDLNEYSPLLSGQNYRSLNLKSNNKNNKHKSKRYFSTNNPNSNDLFAFPHSNNNMSHFYDEYEEDDEMFSNDQVQPRRSHQSLRQLSKVKSMQSSNLHLNDHFLLPRKQHNNSVQTFKNVIYSVISIFLLLLIGFISGVLIATNKELQDVSLLEVRDIVVSSDELIFSFAVEAFNPGFLALEIKYVELDIFAKSGYLENLVHESTLNKNEISEKREESSIQTVLLGTIFELESPLTFEGGFLTRKATSQIGQVKLTNPGTISNSSDSDLFKLHGIEANNKKSEIIKNDKKWNIISKNPFDLIIRGILKYKLPLNSSFRSVLVNKVVFVDPNKDDDEDY